MKCPICKQEMEQDEEHFGVTINDNNDVVEILPSLICPTCGYVLSTK